MKDVRDVQARVSNVYSVHILGRSSELQLLQAIGTQNTQAACSSTHHDLRNAATNTCVISFSLLLYH